VEFKFQAFQVSEAITEATSQYCVPEVRTIDPDGVTVSTVQQVPKAGRLDRLHVARTAPGAPLLSELSVSEAEFVPPTRLIATSICVSVKLPEGVKAIPAVDEPGKLVEPDTVQPAPVL
jgi:hypothetical protein